MSQDIFARPWAQITLTPLTERRSEEGEKALPTMSLSQYTTSKSEERRGFGKPHNGLKWKGKNTTADSKKTVDNRVVINQGMISEDEDCKLVVQMGSKEALKVRKDEVAGRMLLRSTPIVINFPCRGELHSIIPRSEGGRQNAMQSK